MVVVEISEKISFEEDSVEDELSMLYESAVTSNDLILERILNLVTFDDLLTCSLINKRWNYMSRWELRRSRKCYARITNNQPNHQLLSFSEQFENHTKLPFTGLSLRLTDDPDDCSIDGATILKTSNALSKLPIKYLKLTFSGDPDSQLESLAVQLIKSLIKERGEEILEISLGTADYHNFENFANFFGIESDKSQNWLPNVNSLELFNEQSSSFLKAFVEAAPKLQKIYGCIRPENLSELLALNKAQFITEFSLESVRENNADELIRFAEVEPNLQNLSIAWQSEQKELWLSVVVLFLDCTYLRLRKLQIEHFDLLLLTSAEKNCLLNLQELTVNFNGRLDRHLGFLSMGKINYDFVFPNLESIEISESMCFRGYSEEEIALIPDSFINSNLEPFVCMTVKSIKICNNCFKLYTKSACEPLALIFPNVINLEIVNCNNIDLYLKYCLISGWENLESLTLYTLEYPINRTNFDSLFCGISEEESAFLQSLEKINSGLLQNLQVVPSQWSLQHMRGLKSLKLEISHDYVCTAVKSCHSIGALTYLTGNLIFARMPDLNVEIIRNECTTKKEIPCDFRFEDLSNFVRISSAKKTIINNG